MNESTQLNLMPASSVPKGRGKFTVVEQVYFQHRGEQPHSCPTRFSVRIDSADPVKVLNLEVTEEEQRLELSFPCCAVIIKNLEKCNDQVVPTEEEREQITAKIVEVHRCLLIPPGEGLRFRPSDALAFVWLRSQLGIAKVEVTLFPA